MATKSSFKAKIIMCESINLSNHIYSVRPQVTALELGYIYA